MDLLLSPVLRQIVEEAIRTRMDRKLLAEVEAQESADANALWAKAALLAGAEEMA